MQVRRLEAKEGNPIRLVLLPAAVALPTAQAVQACNQRATDEVGEPGRSEDTIKTEELAGSLHGLDESKRNDEKYRAAYARCMRARGYVAG